MPAQYVLLYDLEEYTHVTGSNVLSIYDGSEAELLASHLVPDVLLPLMLNSLLLWLTSKGLGCLYLCKRKRTSHWILCCTVSKHLCVIINKVLPIHYFKTLLKTKREYKNVTLTTYATKKKNLLTHWLKWRYSHVFELL